MSEYNKKICIIDYRTGNIGSVSNLLNKLNLNFCISSDNNDFTDCSHFILPGVGSFSVAMKNMTKYVDIKFLEKEIFNKKKPILGICVGMQLMAGRGLEYGEHKGLGWVDGTVKIIDSKKNSLPHIGWNSIIKNNNNKILDGIETGDDFYFVNSYCLNSETPENQIAYTEYGTKFVSAINKENIYGVQFHPEKSQRNGKKLILNFSNL